MEFLLQYNNNQTPNQSTFQIQGGEHQVDTRGGVGGGVGVRAGGNYSKMVGLLWITLLALGGKLRVC